MKTIEEIEKEMDGILEEQTRKDDPEKYHGDADDLLCEALELLGYKSLVEKYEKVDKYYI